MMNSTIKYTSKNGYSGVLYGESSMSIYDKEGKEVLHTGQRNVNTYEELVDLIENFPDFRRRLKKALQEISLE